VTRRRRLSKWSTTRPTLHHPPPPAPNRHPPLLSAMSARSIVRCPFAILAFPNALHYFRPIRQTTGFYGEDYSMWSDKIRHHLTSHHKSIWDIVEYGAQVPKKGDKDYDSEEVDQIRHFNSQATTILLASLSREEYNKMQGLKSAKEIWDVL
jgi:hypothetical protein